MLRYAIRRVFQIIPVFLIATLLIFIVVRALPGDPVAAYGGERSVSPELREQLIERYNLDGSLPEQYFGYLKDIFIDRDFGDSISKRRPVNDVFRDAVPRTIRLALLAVLFEAILGVGIGIFAARKPNGWFDNSMLISTLVLLAMPVFVMAGIAQVWFGVKWGIFPVSGIRDGFLSYVLPALVIAMGSLAIIARLMRSTLMETMGEDYIRTARAKGASETRVTSVHALRNAFIPVLTVIGIDLGALLGGAIVTESVFQIPGIGFEIVGAIRARDNALVIGVSTMLVIAYMLINLIVDLLYAWLDPRIRYD